MPVENSKPGLVYLVGAGPGDPGLITVRGKECLERAQVVIYDRLVSPRLISLVPAGAELIYVGKSPERHTLKQDEINRLLVEKALEGKTVVRLKGGDPFVFGRGGEEAEELVEHGIPFQVVPGITSAISVPAYAGIPVTHRDFTSTLALVTGNEDPDKDDSSIAWDKLATGIGTLIFLMGMANLPRICARLVEFGRDPATPVALIRWGTRPEQQTLLGTLADIVPKSTAAGFSNPAIIVVGRVVELRERLNWFERRPLFGRRVVVTRAREQASRLSNRLEELGAEVWEFPTIAIAGPADYGPLDRALGNLSAYHWVVFTSVNGVEHFFRRLWEKGGDVRDLAGVNLCAIGPATRDALVERGLRVEFIPEEFRAESVAERLGREGVAGSRILLPRADIARQELAVLLREMGAQVDEVTAYRTVPAAGDAGALRSALQDGRIQAVTFTSSSTVRNFVQALGGDAADLLHGVTVASIGPITSQTARQLGLAVSVEAAPYTIDGLVEALLAHYAGTV